MELTNFMVGLAMTREVVGVLRRIVPAFLVSEDTFRYTLVD
jgi:hypothetical protein